MVINMKLVLALLAMSLAGCAGTFATAVHSLPSVENCHDVTYERHGSDVKIDATCSVPVKSDPLLSPKIGL
jgi:hypothetical protein